MFFIIYGTSFKERKLAKEKIASFLSKKGIEEEALLIPPKISKDNFTLLESYIGNTSLFGEKMKVYLDDLLGREDSREYLYKKLKDLVESENIFIADEPFALPASFQKISRDLAKLGAEKNAFDASSQKKEKDIEPFFLAELIEKRDKRSAWQEWKKIYLEWGDDEAQALHGAIWWKWKMIYSAFLDGDRKNYYKLYRLVEREINYSEEEIKSFARELSLMAMRANNGEINLMRSLEKFILSI
ncbi:MAG: hypothetical protein RI945_239 [Candidatus Parcubacteria bacterium]|jgi:hypothetical protein